MKGLANLGVLVAVVGSAFCQVESSMLRGRYGEPVQEVFSVRPGFRMTVLYGAEHQVCRLEISSGQCDSFESSKETNRVLDEIVDEIIPESARGSVKDDLTMYAGFAGQSISTYESLTVNRTLLTSHATGVLSTVVTFKDKNCNGIAQAKRAPPQ